MKEHLIKMLKEGDKPSTMRLMCLVSIFTGVIVGVYGVYQGKDLGGVAQICAVFIGAGFAGKTVQKFAE